MAINFGDMTPVSADTSSAPIQEVTTSTGAVTLNLQKGAILDITKRNPGLKRVVLAAGWDTASGGAAFDLDISAFILNSNGKISSGSDVVFYGNLSVPGIKLNGDNQTGDGNGDDETMDIDLSAIPSDKESIVFAVTIYDAVNRRQTFGMVNNSYVRLLDADNGNKEICRFCLRNDASTSTAMIFAKLKKNGGEWEFEAIGEGKSGDLNAIAAIYS